MKRSNASPKEHMHLGPEAMVVATVLSFGLAVAGREVYDFIQWKRKLRQWMGKLTANGATCMVEPQSRVPAMWHSVALRSTTSSTAETSAFPDLLRPAQGSRDKRC